MKLALLALTLSGLLPSVLVAADPQRAAADVVIARSGVSRAQAEVLACAYLDRFLSGCGAVYPPVRVAGGSWTLPVRVGYAGRPAGRIRVDRRTAAVSYLGHQVAYPHDFAAPFARRR